LYLAGAAERVGHAEINVKYNAVVLIRTSDGAEVSCSGISKGGEGGFERSLLSLAGQAFAKEFGFPDSKGKSLGQLIFLERALPIIMLVAGGVVQIWELRDFKRGKKMLVRGTGRWEMVGGDRWREMLVQAQAQAQVQG
jgi:hypothetical protein